MPQNRTTGAAGDAFGRRMAPKVASAIGAVMSLPGTNRAHWRGLRIVIKCAKMNNSRVGVTSGMLKTLDAIVAAFQRRDGDFDLFQLDAGAFRAHMGPTRSTGPSAGLVQQVSRDAFESSGEHLASVSLELKTPFSQQDSPPTLGSVFGDNAHYKILNVLMPGGRTFQSQSSCLESCPAYSSCVSGGPDRTICSDAWARAYATPTNLDIVHHVLNNFDHYNHDDQKYGQHSPEVAAVLERLREWPIGYEDEPSVEEDA